jgi:hypothetical protein
MPFRTSYKTNVPPAESKWPEVEPQTNPYEYAREFQKLGRELTPEEQDALDNYYNWKPTGGFPIGGSVGPMPYGTMPRGALHMNDGRGGYQPQPAVGPDMSGDVINY